MVNFKKLEDKSDEELVRLTLADQDYFVFLIKRYEAKLLNYILKISSFDKSEAEDILQETFISVYQNLNEFDEKLKFSSWVYRIAHNRTISHYRKKKSRGENIPFDLENDHLKKLASDIDISRDMDSVILKEKINQVLAKIDLKYREVLILKFLEEKNYREISDILKKPMGTVATLINRAKEKFRQELHNQNINLL